MKLIRPSGNSTAGKSATRTVHCALAALFLSGLAATAGCSVPDPDGTGADIVSQRSDPAANGTAPSAGGDDTAPGTRQRPLPAGTTVKVGDWQVTLGPTVLDATAQITAENQFNDPPAAGRQFVLVPVNVTYAGTGSGTPWVDLSIRFYGSGGNTFGAGGTDDYCGVVPNSFNNVSEMFPEASAAGNACVSVPGDQAAGGSWIVEESLSLDGGRVFFALS
ncbi:hypothetical protein UG55_103512 [Frankia sp. EI5c]|uniref:hypothetical protein n=1 Tax=Frankia sp. EI5c TaxID=683316 RepID=UPI0007C3171C|nr:hypothetical protein [Frankia sp. EI5c]OAA23578.1 hypothetical protein UG55_103512 [Frankia sp. EI5c]